MMESPNKLNGTRSAKALVTPIIFDEAEWKLMTKMSFAHQVRYERDLSKLIAQRLSERGEVWGVGLWPDAETEKIAHQCAEIIAEEYAIDRAALIPEDSITVFQVSDDDAARGGVGSLEAAFGCTIDGEKLGEKGDVLFRDLVEMVMATRGSKPVTDPPPEPGVVHPLLAPRSGWKLLWMLLWPLAVFLALVTTAVVLVELLKMPGYVSSMAFAVWIGVFVANARYHKWEFFVTNLIRFLIATGVGLWLLTHV